MADLVVKTPFCADRYFVETRITALNRLQETLKPCLFTGDHPEGDFEGQRSIGMDAVLVARNGTCRIPGEYVLNSLGDIRKWIT